MVRKPDQNRRVVVTGLGVVSSLGIGWEEFWKNLIAGKSGISKVTGFDASKHDRQYAGEVKNFNPKKFINSRKIAQFGRASQMVIAASKLAIQDSKLKLGEDVRKKTAVCIGTTTGEIGNLEKFHDTKASSKSVKSQGVSSFPANSLSAAVAKELRLWGVNLVFGTACSSGNYAVGYGYDLVKTGRQNYVLAGGGDGFSRIVFTGFGRMYAIAPEKCQPFDKNRKGMIPAEGAGVVLLENFDSAIKRKARIYAEILGYGLSCDGHHMTNPSPSGIAKAIRRSLLSSQAKETQIDYINAHGTGTIENDAAECQALKAVFGKILQDTPVSSIKSMLGHTMGAASALESIACCLALAHAKVPPTINFQNRDEECDIDCVPLHGRQHKMKVVLNTSQAFGGNNACVVFGKYTDA